MTDPQKHKQLKILQLIMSNTNELIWAVDHEYRLLFANESFQTVVEARLGKRILINESVFSEILLQQNLEFWKTNYDRCFKNEAFNIVASFNKNGEMYYSENSLIPLKMRMERIVVLLLFRMI